MSIRTKLFLLLLIFSIGPLALESHVARSGLIGTRDRLSADARERLNQVADETRAHLVEKHAAILDRDRALAEVDVRTAAAALRRHHRALPADASPQRPVYSSDDFDRGAVPGMVPVPGQFRIVPGGTREPLAVSEEHPVFVFQTPGPRDGPADGFRAAQAHDAALLERMTPTFRGMRDHGASVIEAKSRYAALARTRTHMSWPGKGGYPADYDPTRRSWYQAAINVVGAEEVVWIGPTVDAPTGQVRMTCAAPVYDDDGASLIGVVAVDMLLLDVLSEIDLPETFKDRSRVMLVSIDEGLVGASGSPRIVGTAEYDLRGGIDSGVPLSLDPFEADDPADGPRLLAAMRAAESGSLEMRSGGAPWVWTFERVAGDETFVLVGISRDAAEEAAIAVAGHVSETINSTISNTVTVGYVVIALAATAGFLGARSVTRPVRSLAATAAAIAEGDLDATADVRSRDELGVLARSFNGMVPKLRDRLHVRESLLLARQVQQHLLPRGAPSVPGFDIAARNVYADETGGDYYDFFELDGGRLMMVIGDVTGHGIASALLMTTARAHLHARTELGEELAAIMGRVNRSLANDARAGQFMTLYMLELDPSAHRARWVSAGHDAAMVFDLDARAFTEYEGADVPLGVEGAWTFTERSAPLPDSAVAVLGTDGIWEARSPAGELFGKDRLRAVVREHADRGAGAIADAVLAAVVDFRQGGPQSDDITLIVLRWARTGHPDQG
jgi:sigma-B regulation protein RsbU (phosphoserine phosphatase)